MGKPEAQQQQQQDSNCFKLVGFTKFIRTNPKSDRFPVLSFHHVEFYTSDASAAAARFSLSLGIPPHSRSTSSFSSPHTSILLKNPSFPSPSFLFTAPSPSFLAPFSDPPSVPSFDLQFAYSFIARHSLAVRAVAVEVASASAAFEVAVKNGAVEAFAPKEMGMGFEIAEVELYGDVVLRFVSCGSAGGGGGGGGDRRKMLFLPGFESLGPDQKVDYGIRSLDHAVGNVEQLAPVVSYMKR